MIIIINKNNNTPPHTKNSSSNNNNNRSCVKVEVVVLGSRDDDGVQPSPWRGRVRVTSSLPSEGLGLHPAFPVKVTLGLGLRPAFPVEG